VEQIIKPSRGLHRVELFAYLAGLREDIVTVAEDIAHVLGLTRTGKIQ
jgi:hypothetical protein